MKKKISILCVLLALAVLFSACDVNSNMEPAVRQMLDALCAGDIDTAKTYLHPDIFKINDDPTAGLLQISTLLAGRTVTEMKQTNMYVTMKFGTDFTGRQEQGIFVLTLNDGTQCQLEATYFDGTSKGFMGFYIHFEQSQFQPGSSAV